MRGTNFSLSGKNINCGNNLTGKRMNTDNVTENIDIQKLKLQIMSLILFPIISQQWITIIENRFVISVIKKKIDKLYKKYYQQYHHNHITLKDLLFYKDVLLLAESIINEHMELTELEKKLYGKNNDVGTIIFRTKMIKLRPEFEVYNLLIGKPDKDACYDNDILQYIAQLINQENITFDKIKKQINEMILHNDNYSNMVKNKNN